MTDDRRDPFPPFTAGESAFLIRGDRVHVLGQDGSEATFPLSDLESFLDHLSRRLRSTSSRSRSQDP